MKVETLIKKITEGDKDAIATLYNEYKSMVFAAALSILRCKADAEDIMADAFIKIIKNANNYNGGSAKAWIYSITRNLCFDHLKKSKNEISVDYTENESLYGQYSIEEDFANNLALKTALKELDIQEREIVMMYNSGFKHREIASILSLPLGTVTWKYNNSLKKLKQAMMGG